MIPCTQKYMYRLRNVRTGYVLCRALVVIVPISARNIENVGVAWGQASIVPG